jgi:hypothetical protein
MSAEDFSEYLKKKTGRVVIGPSTTPKGEPTLWITDGHHLACALVGVRGEKMRVEVDRNWSDLSRAEFYRRMKEREKFWLYDENGEGPLDPRSLPETIVELRTHDDPYRSLVWRMREAEGIEKVATPFAEFKWAQALRRKISQTVVVNEPDRALKLALEFAASDEAKGLPGFDPKTARRVALECAAKLVKSK